MNALTNRVIRVGIIGVGGWARYGHIPALRSLDAFDVHAVSSRTAEKAEKLAAELDIPHAYGDYRDLVGDPDVDLVVIPAPAPEHLHLAEAAIAAGKDVYSEWPLTTTTADSERLLALAEAAGVRHVVGLQRRFAPSARYTADLVRDGYVGRIRSVNMSVGVDAFPPVMSQSHSWTFDPANLVHLLPVYFGHFGDLLFTTAGYPDTLTAVTANDYPNVTVAETGEQVPRPTPTEVMAIGALENGALFSIQLEGAQTHRTGVHIDITGTDGALRVTNSRGFENKDDNTVAGMTGESEVFTTLPIPAMYQTLPQGDLDTSTHDVAYVYTAYANDKRDNTNTASNFADGVRLHRLIDQMEHASDECSGPIANTL